MATAIRWSADPKFVGSGKMAKLSGELTTTLDVNCYATLSIDADPDLHPGENRITITSDVALGDVALDAALAAFPTIGPGVTGTFAVTANTLYKIGEFSLPVGDHMVIDAHVHAALGTLASSDASWFDTYIVVWRNGDGGIQIEVGGQPSVGRIPGVAISADSTAETVQVFISTRKSGTLTLFANDVEVISQGKLA